MATTTINKCKTKLLAKSHDIPTTKKNDHYIQKDQYRLDLRRENTSQSSILNILIFIHAPTPSMLPMYIYLPSLVK